MEYGWHFSYLQIFGGMIAHFQPALQILLGGVLAHTLQLAEKGCDELNDPPYEIEAITDRRGVDLPRRNSFGRATAVAKRTVGSLRSSVLRLFAGCRLVFGPVVNTLRSSNHLQLIIHCDPLGTNNLAVVPIAG